MPGFRAHRTLMAEPTMAMVLELMALAMAATSAVRVEVISLTTRGCSEVSNALLLLLANVDFEELARLPQVSARSTGMHGAP